MADGQEVGSFGTILLVKRKGTVKGRLNLDSRVCTFGRADRCDVRIQLDSVSRRHARLEISQDGSKATLICESSNGILINDKRLGKGDKVEVLPQDIINIQERFFRFVGRPSGEFQASASEELFLESTEKSRPEEQSPVTQASDARQEQENLMRMPDDAATILQPAADRKGPKSPRHLSPTSRRPVSVHGSPPIFTNSASPRKMSPQKSRTPKGPAALQEVLYHSPTRSRSAMLAFNDVSPLKASNTEHSQVVANISETAAPMHTANAPLELSATRRSSLATERITTPARGISKPLTTHSQETTHAARTPVPLAHDAKASRLLVNSGGPRRVATTTPAKRYITAAPFTAPRTFQARLQGGPKRPLNTPVKPTTQTIIDETLVESAKSAHKEFIAAAHDIAFTSNTPSRAMIAQSCIHPALLAGSPAQQALKDPQTPIDPSSIHEMLQALSVAPTPRFEGIRRLFTEQDNVTQEEIDLSQSRHLLKTPKAMQTPRLAGVREMLAEPTSAKTPRFAGLRELLAEPASIQTPRFAGLREMLAEATVLESPRFSGVKELLAQPPDVKTPRFAGLRELLAEPRQQQTPRFAGVRQLLAEASQHHTPDLTGVRELLANPRLLQTPRYAGVRELLTESVQAGTPDLAGLQRLFENADLQSPIIDGNRALDAEVRRPQTSTLRMIERLPTSPILASNAAANQHDPYAQSPSRQMGGLVEHAVESSFEPSRLTHDEAQPLFEDATITAMRGTSGELSADVTGPTRHEAEDLEIAANLSSFPSTHKLGASLRSIHAIATPAKGSVKARKSLGNRLSNPRWHGVELSARPHTTRKEATTWRKSALADYESRASGYLPHEVEGFVAALPRSPEMKPVHHVGVAKMNTSPSMDLKGPEPFALGTFSPIRESIDHKTSTHKAVLPLRTPLRQQPVFMDLAARLKTPQIEVATAVQTGSPQQSPLIAAVAPESAAPSYRTSPHKELAKAAQSVDVSPSRTAHVSTRPASPEKWPQTSPPDEQVAAIDMQQHDKPFDLEADADEPTDEVEEVLPAPTKVTPAPLATRAIPSSLPVRSTRLRGVAGRQKEDKVLKTLAPATEPIAASKAIGKSIVEPSSRGKENIPKRKAASIKSEPLSEAADLDHLSTKVSTTRSLRSRAR